jgi:hypothetical protein
MNHETTNDVKKARREKRKVQTLTHMERKHTENISVDGAIWIQARHQDILARVEVQAADLVREEERAVLLPIAHATVRVVSDVSQEQ